MTHLFLVLTFLVMLSSNALAGRYISSVSMTIDSREGLYLEPNKNIAPNPLVKKEAKDALANLHDTNQRIVEFKEELRTSCYARDVKTGEFLRFSELTDEEFVIWERMKGERADPKKYTSEFIAQRKAFLDAKEKMIKEELAKLDEYKDFRFGKGADARAQELNIKAAHTQHLLEEGKAEKPLADKASREFAAVEEKFLNGHLPARAGSFSHGRKVTGAIGAAVIGASVAYDLATGNGAQASDLKAQDLSGEVEPGEQNRSELGIAALDE